MLHRLIRGVGGSFRFPGYVGLFNGEDTLVGGTYQIGRMTSGDGGQTFEVYAGNPVLTPGAGGSWDATWVVDPWLVNDGTQLVCYYAGIGTGDFQIGRATSPDGITWTKYAGNPIITGTAGNWDGSGCNFPTVWYDPGDTPKWRMWYTGFGSGATAGRTAVGYAYSSDGLSWTKVARMLDVGSPGDFDDVGLATGPVRFDSGTWYVYYAGLASGGGSGPYHTGVASTPTPDDDTSYTKLGECPGLDTSLTLSGVTYNSNQLRTIQPISGGFLGLGSAFHPGGVVGHEVTFRSISSDGVTWSTPTGPILTMTGWDANSAENPSIIPTP